MLQVTKHKHDGEWVIRLESPLGHVGLGAAVGDEEATIMVAILQGAIQLATAAMECHADNRSYGVSWRLGMENANNMVGGDLFLAFAESVGLAKGGE